MAHVAQSSSSTWQFWIDVTGCSFSLAWPLVVAGIREVAQQSSAPISTSKTKQHKMEASFIAKKKNLKCIRLYQTFFMNYAKNYIKINLQYTDSKDKEKSQKDSTRVFKITFPFWN